MDTLGVRSRRYVKATKCLPAGLRAQLGTGARGIIGPMLKVADRFFTAGVTAAELPGRHGNLAGRATATWPRVRAGDS